MERVFLSHTARFVHIICIHYEIQWSRRVDCVDILYEAYWLSMYVPELRVNVVIIDKKVIALHCISFHVYMLVFSALKCFSIRFPHSSDWMFKLAFGGVEQMLCKYLKKSSIGFFSLTHSFILYIYFSLIVAHALTSFSIQLNVVTIAAIYVKRCLMTLLKRKVTCLFVV